MLRTISVVGHALRLKSSWNTRTRKGSIEASTPNPACIADETLDMDWITTTYVLDQLKNDAKAPAWDHLYESFHHVIVAFARKLGLSPTDADDAAQEAMMAFIVAFRNGRYDRNKGRLSHWLFGVARLSIKNYRRRAPREKLIADKQTNTGFWQKLPDENELQKTWADEWHQMVMQKCLQQARHELEPRTFEAFRLYALCEKSVKDVAAQLEMTTNAVYIAKNRVLSRLRELEKDFEGTTRT